MTMKKFAFNDEVCSSQNWVDDKDYESEAGRCSETSKIIINPPPEDGTCDFCQRHVGELEAFGGPGDPLDDVFSGAKLVKSFRYDYPYHVGSTWECRDCFVRPEPLWWINSEERHLGRRLMDTEINEVQRRWNLEAKRYDLELSLLAMDEESNQSES